jgi:hypothetical protein
MSHETDFPVWNFEQEPYDERKDETSVNLRAYLDRMPDEKMQKYRKDWSDQQVMDWDGNFKDEDGENSLFLICSEREVDVAEYRKVLEQAIAYRDRVRSKLTGAAK